MTERRSLTRLGSAICGKRWKEVAPTPLVLSSSATKATIPITVLGTSRSKKIEEFIFCNKRGNSTGECKGNNESKADVDTSPLRSRGPLVSGWKEDGNENDGEANANGTIEIDIRDQPCKSRGTMNLGVAPQDTDCPLPSVLVVDDAVSNRKMLSRLLKSRCRTISQAADGREALNMVIESLSAASELQYDIILMDFIMPEMDGPTATKEIRKAGYTGLLFGLTGNVLESDIEYFIAQGANDVLTKPFDIKAYDGLVAELHRGGQLLVPVALGSVQG